MKAEDTVINFMRIEEIDAKNATSNFTDALVDVAREQAGISFKAGIKEVVEWLGCHYVVKPDKDSLTQFVPYYMISVSDIQSKLKEWGLQ